jgi:alkylated DNA repair protein alkB family protein 1
MSGHLDDGEKDQKSPIFSFSFGISSIFLMGDVTKDFNPLPIKLDSGDLMVMSGYSRNCYHGVPRVLSGSF